MLHLKAFPDLSRLGRALCYDSASHMVFKTFACLSASPTDLFEGDSASHLHTPETMHRTGTLVVECLLKLVTVELLFNWVFFSMCSRILSFLTDF